MWTLELLAFINLKT